MSAPRIIAQIIATGAQIFVRAFADAYKQAAANAAKQQTASAAAGTAAAAGSRNATDELTRKTGLTAEESTLILNLGKEPSREDIIERYEHLFKQNDPTKGGSFYLQSKVFRAKERLELEMDLAVKERPAEGEPPKE